MADERLSENPGLSDNEAKRDEPDISLIDMLIVLAKYKWLLLGLPFLAAVIAAGFALSIPNIFTAATKILPPQQNQSAGAAILAQLGGGIAGFVGGAGGLKNPNDIYIAMLKSRGVADNIVKQFGLMQLWEIDPKYPSDAYDRLARITTITSAKDGLIVIEVEDKDPKRAAEVANSYVENLVRLTNVLAVTEASQRRLFFERQFAVAKDNLSKAEAVARNALQTGGLVKVDDQGRAMVEVTARLRGQIAVKEVQIGAMRTFAADRNPDLLLAQQELASLKRELAKTEGTDGNKLTTKDLAGHGSDSIRLLRDVKYHEVIFELLAKQYEVAKIEEAKDASTIQVLDRAIAPDRKSKPKRTQIVLLSALACAFILVIWAFAREAFSRARKNPEQARRLDILRNYLWAKRKG